MYIENLNVLLPDDIWFIILNKLGRKDLSKVLLLNKSFKEITRNYLKTKPLVLKKLKIKFEPNYFTKKDKCFICKKNVRNKPTNKRHILTCKCKRKWISHYNCYNTFKHVFYCNKCGYHFRLLKKIDEITQTYDIRYTLITPI